jgi:spore maturation protein SpmB
MRRSSALALALFLTGSVAAFAANTVTVTTTAASGAGSLADAIAQANSGACGSGCTIKFNVAGTFATSGYTITAQGLSIDGYSAPGASPNHGGFPQPNDAAITVNIVPNGTVNTAFLIQADGVTLDGLGISGFSSDAVIIDGTTLSSSQNTVSGCFVTGNGGGVRIQGANATNNLVGTGRPASNPVAGNGTGRPADRNVIGNNANYDVVIANASNNAVAGNNLGVAGNGTSAIPSPKGVWITGSSSTNAVGGSSPNNTNVIGGHADGILIDGATGTLINGNWVGVNINGTGAVANTIGIRVVNGGNTTSIGALRANVVSGNTTGIRIESATGSVNVQGNLIGTDVNGVGALGNSGNGIETANSAGNVVIQTNTIAFNGANGIAPGGTGVQIRGNAIYGNAGRAINLTGGAAPVNDVGDVDTGNDNLQNYPNASTVRIVSGVLMFDATVDSSATANGSMAIDVFKADPSGQARTYLGTTGCVAGNTLTLYPVSIPAGPLVAGDAIVTTTTTYGNSNCSSAGDGTSELSPAALTCAAPPAVFSVPSFVCTSSTNNVASVGATSGATYSWTVTNGTLTGGQGTSSITFTAGASGNTIVQVVASFGSCANPNSVSIPIRALPDVTMSVPAAVCAGTTGVAASVPAATGVTFNWSVSGGTLTSGQGTNSITFDVPSNSGGVTLIVSAVANGCSSANSANVVVDHLANPDFTAPSFVCANSTSNAASVVSTSGATYTWTVTNGTLTGGQGTPAITFTAGASGNTTLQVVAVSGSCTKSNSATVPINAVPDATISAPADVCAGSTAVTASVPANPSATFLWNVTGATLTGGQGTNSITFDVPSNSAGVSITVSATANGCAGSSSANVGVDNLAAPTVTAPASMTVGTSGGASVTASAGAAYNWSITNGSITGGQGTPSITFTAGAGALTIVSVTETLNACTKSGNAHVTVIPPVVITTPSLPIGSIDFPYSLQFTATGGSGALTWSFAHGTLPPLLQLTPGGLLSGTPKTTFDGFIDVTATDGVRSNTKTFHVVVVSGLVVATTSLPNAAFGAPYHATVVAAGGTQPYTWSLKSGILPGGLTLNPDGTITGNAVSEGVFPFTVSVVDQHNVEAHAPLSITVGSALRIVTLGVPGATIGTDYSFALQASGGTPFSSGLPYTWSLVGGSLPAGLTLSSGGTISGKPTTTDSSLFTVRVTDAFSFVEQQFFLSGSCGTPDLAAPKVSAVREVTTDQRYQILWHEVAGASGYELEESMDPEFDDNPAPTELATPGYETRHHSDKAIAYYYRVRAVSTCAGATSTWSRTNRVVIVPLPSPTDRPLHITLPYGNADQLILEIFIPGSDNFSAPPSNSVNAFAVVPVAPPPNAPFTVTSTNPGVVSVSPQNGTLPPTGVTITAVVGPATLPPGTTTTTINVANAATGAPIASVPLSVSLVTPVLPLPTASIASSSLVIPAVAHIDGTGATFSSDLRVGNVSLQSATYEVTFTPWGNGDQAQTTDFPVAAGTTVLLDDVVRHMFGFGSLPSDGQAGTLSIKRLDTNTDPHATVAWTHMYSGDLASRVGQFIPSIGLDKFAGVGQTLSLQQVAQSASSRTNLGVIESTGNPVTLLATAFGANGVQLGQFPINVSASEHTQLNSILAANGITAPDARLQLSVIGGAGKIAAYASVVDNGSTDASLVPAVDPNGVASNHYVIPGVAHTDSVAASWRSDVRIFNPSTAYVPLALGFVPQNSSDKQQSTVTVGPGEVVSLDDVVSKTFGQSTAGALHVEPPVALPLVVTARTYRNGGGAGTLGQFINAVTPNDATGAGGRILNMVGVEESQSMHTNLGIYETSGNPASAEVTVTTADGRASARFQLDLQPNEFRQLSSVMSQIGMSDEYNASIAVRVTSGTGRVGAYSSVIENASGDPLFVPAQ